jgi:twitching motility protein PilT
MRETSMLTRVLKAAVQRGASDVHAKAGDVFRARVDGKLVPLTKSRLTTAQTRALAATFASMDLTDPRLDNLRDFNSSWGIPGVGRFRVNVLRQRSSFMVVLRVIPFSVPTPEGLGIPEVITRFADAGRGMLVVAGTGGSGRTSTIAALVHHINRSSSRHVITLEDPIEYLHRDLTGCITQREIGTDTDDVATGIQAALRQDPDVVVIADLRDPVSLDRAVRTAESPRLVIVGVSAPDAVSAVTQLLMTMPPEERDAGRVRLAAALNAVVAQRLVPDPDGEGRRAEIEWVLAEGGFRAAIDAGGEPGALGKAFDRAVKDGRAEGFTLPAKAD